MKGPPCLEGYEFACVVANRENTTKYIKMAKGVGKTIMVWRQPNGGVVNRGGSSIGSVGPVPAYQIWWRSVGPSKHKPRAKHRQRHV